MKKRPLRRVAWKRDRKPVERDIIIQNTVGSYVIQIILLFWFRNDNMKSKRRFYGKNIYYWQEDSNLAGCRKKETWGGGNYIY